MKVFPKVSGSKGIQLYIPLNTASTYEITHPFALCVAELVERQKADLTVSEMAKEKRVEKGFID